jgi:hypothetical protein
MMRSAFALIAIFAITLCSFSAIAHSPLGTGDGTTLATASVIPDPAKSWAIYSSLDDEHAVRYYMFEIEKGERIYVSLIISAGARNAGFLPSFALMGPNLTDENAALLPSYAERLPDEGNGIIVIEGELPAQGTYEPFSPSGYYEIGELDIDAPASGQYYIVVFYDPEETPGGNFALAVGYLEEFTLEEWLFLPFTLISVYAWSGMSIILVLAPIAIVLVLGIAWLYSRHRNGKTPKSSAQWMTGIAGVLALSWGANVVFEMISALTYTMIGSEIVITIGFAGVSVLIGVYMLKIALGDEPKIPVRRGILLIAFGGLMIAFLSGFLIGSILAISVGISTFFEEKERQGQAPR